MDLIYPEQEFENRFLWVIWYKPPLFTILAPFLSVFFLVGVGFAFVLIWFVGQVAFTVLSGGAESLSSFLAPGLFIAVGGFLAFVAVGVNYRYYYFYTRDLIKIAMGERQLTLSKGFSDWERSFDEIRSIEINPDQTDRYYGDYHLIKIHTEDSPAEEFILTTNQNYSIPGLSFRLPSKQTAFDSFYAHLMASDLAEKVTVLDED